MAEDKSHLPEGTPAAETGDQQEDTPQGVTRLKMPGSEK
jgi:hypothetical protein